MHESLARLLPPEEEARVFWRLRRRLFWNTLTQTLRVARLRVSLVLVLTVIFWVTLFLLFLGGFDFLRVAIANRATREETVRLIYGVFFASLLVMLVFSTAIMLYGGLYRAREIAFLMTTPARAERVFMHKFQEAMLFSSWGFLLLGTPMLAAYGIVAHAPWYYYALLAPCLISFVYIPGAIGAAACMLIVRFLPRRSRPLIYLGSALAIVAVIALVRAMLPDPSTAALTPAWFQDVLGRLQFSQHRLLPSWWLSTGLLEATQDRWTESLMFMALLISNALLAHQVVIWISGRVYRAGFSRLADFERARRRGTTSWLDALVGWVCQPLPAAVRLMIVKDLRLFRRDPLQWTQFLIFLGLIGLYFLNIRRLSYDPDQDTWINMVSFLNLAVVGLILSTFTNRFIYPMVSLEGRRFWILGRLPLARDTILWSKFLFAAGGSLAPCVLLIMFSDMMLGVSGLVVAIHLLCCVLLCLGLAGISVGFGAKMPVMREESPAKIATGFGGTLSLVVSTMYIVTIVLLTAVPSHFYVAAQGADPGGFVFDAARLRMWIVAGTVSAIVIGIASTWLPLWMGFRAFRRLEF